MPLWPLSSVGIERLKTTSPGLNEKPEPYTWPPSHPAAPRHWKLSSSQAEQMLAFHLCDSATRAFLLSFCRLVAFLLRPTSKCSAAAATAWRSCFYAGFELCSDPGVTCLVLGICALTRLPEGKNLASIKARFLTDPLLNRCEAWKEPWVVNYH